MSNIMTNNMQDGENECEELTVDDTTGVVTLDMNKYVHTYGDKINSEELEKDIKKNIDVARSELFDEIKSHVPTVELMLHVTRWAGTSSFHFHRDSMQLMNICARMLGLTLMDVMFQKAYSLKKTEFGYGFQVSFVKFAYPPSAKYLRNVNRVDALMEAFEELYKYLYKSKNTNFCQLRKNVESNIQREWPSYAFAKEYPSYNGEPSSKYLTPGYAKKKCWLELEH